MTKNCTITLIYSITVITDRVKIEFCLDLRIKNSKLILKLYITYEPGVTVVSMFPVVHVGSAYPTNSKVLKTSQIFIKKSQKKSCDCKIQQAVSLNPSRRTNQTYVGSHGMFPARKSREKISAFTMLQFFF